MQIIEDKSYTTDEVLEIIGKHAAFETQNTPRAEKKLSVTVDDHPVYVHSLRYKMFYQKGFECVSCGAVGTHFKLVGDSSSNRRHFELYTDDEVLMTRDHIMPRSRGGADSLKNSQPMCSKCNRLKSDKLPFKPDITGRRAAERRASIEEKYAEALVEAKIRLLNMKIDYLFKDAFFDDTGHELNEDSLLEDLRQSALIDIKPSLSKLQYDERIELAKRLEDIENYKK